MTFYMPTKIIEGDDVVCSNSHLFKELGAKALIVTGKRSAKLNGALNDVTEALKEQSIEYVLFDGITENPPIEQVIEGAEVGKDCDFVIGIGGGSPIDGAKGMALLIKNPSDKPFDMLYKTKDSKALPLIVLPTTGGTGTETTPYAVYTDHRLATKTSMTQRVFPKYALMDVKYYMHMPVVIRNSTCVDALTHSIESYMNTNATKYSDFVAMESIRMWGEVKECLLEDEMDKETMTALMTASTLAGIAISQTGTSIPHSMGYPLTYHHGLAHGKANAVFMASYLNACSNKWKVANIMDALGFGNLSEFASFVHKTVGGFTISDEEIETFTDLLMANERKLKNHPDKITREDVLRIYKESVGETND